MPTGIYTRTEEHKRILEKSRVKAVKKSAELRRGVSLSKEHRNKISQAYDYNKFVTLERNKKISEKLTGRKLSPEHCKKISIFLTGRKGVPMTDENKIRLSERGRGEKCTFWKGGRTTLVKQIKNLALYRNWRNSVFKKDNWRCQNCETRGGIELSPDHIKPFSQILDENKIQTQEQARECEELWDVKNGRTLCHPCHKLTDTYGWKIYNKRK